QFAGVITNGSAGLVVVEANKLRLENGGKVTSDTSYFTTGNAGSITVDADSSVVITNPVNRSQDAPLSYISSQSLGTGEAGQVAVTAPDISIENGSLISSLSIDKGDAGSIQVQTDNLKLVNGGFILGSTDGNGEGGPITVNVNGKLSITGVDTVESKSSAIKSEAKSDGDGGNIQVTVKDLYIGDGGTISAASDANSNAGTVTINTENEIHLSNSSIETSSEQAAGGNIIVNVGKALKLDNSNIITNAKGATPQDKGGDISIGQTNSPDLLYMSKSQILAQANAGNGGAISLKARQMLITPDSVINADSRKAISGEIKKTGPEVDLSASIIRVEPEFLDISQLLEKNCYIETLADKSSLTVNKQNKLSRAPAAEQKKINHHEFKAGECGK
ncbi:MAG: hypothetical protein R3240_08765, partial [Gammaproteobacteria bacterium]|nr:hypothetical protein [Gammaproteobacteria bacterium]